MTLKWFLCGLLLFVNAHKDEIAFSSATEILEKKLLFKQEIPSITVFNIYGWFRKKTGKT